MPEGSLVSPRELGGAGVWRGVASAFFACLIGLGIARFSYTPLIPALIGAHWFTPSGAVFLGAANMAGYLAGALSARVLRARLGLAFTLRALMLLATASLLACAWPASFAWFFAWRLISGFAGAGLVVLPAPAVLPFVPARYRGVAGGLIFTGIGLGMAGSGTVLPLLVRAGPGPAWLALAAAAAVATAAAWGGWGREAPGPAAPALPASRPLPPRPPGLVLLFLAYAVSATGQIPSMLFLSDFLARGMGLGIAGGSHGWAIFGAGALAGPLGAGLLADRIGFVAALRANWVAQIVACALMCWAPSAGVVEAAGVVVGAGIPGLVVLVLGRVRELAGEGAPRAWGIATTCFAGGQAVGAYALSTWFRAEASYEALFGTAIVAMAVAFGLGEASRNATSEVLLSRRT